MAWTHILTVGIYQTRVIQVWSWRQSQCSITYILPVCLKEKKKQLYFASDSDSGAVSKDIFRSQTFLLWISLILLTYQVKRARMHASFRDIASEPNLLAEYYLKPKLLPTSTNVLKWSKMEPRGIWWRHSVDFRTSG